MVMVAEIRINQQMQGQHKGDGRHKPGPIDPAHKETIHHQTRGGAVAWAAASSTLLQPCSRITGVIGEDQISTGPLEAQQGLEHNRTLVDPALL